MANVIINLVPGTQEGATEALQSINRLTAADNQAAQAFEKNNQAFQERTNDIKASTAEMSKFVAATKNIPKVIVGGAAREVAELTKNVKTGELAINAYATAAAAAKRQLSELPKDSQQYKTLAAEIRAAATAQEFVAKGATTLRGEFAQVRNAIGALIEAGLQNTKIFRDLTARGGELSDTIGDISERTRALGSDTRNVDAAVEFVGGLAAAYSVAQGAAALLGDENEELQRVLLKVNAAMAVANGLQQVSTLLRGQSAAIQTVENVQRLAGVAATNLQSAAESRYTVVRVLATKAQAALNLAMAANPATVLLVAITALAAGLLILFNRTDEAAEAQAELARQTEFANASLRNQVAIVDSLASADQRQLALLRERGIKGQQLASAERQIVQQQIERNEALIASLQGRQGVEDEYDAALERRVELRSQLLLTEARIAKEAAEAQTKSTKEFLDDQVAAAEIAVLQSRSAYERFEATAQAIIIRLRRTLASTELTPNQRVLAEVEAGQQILEERQKFIGELERLDSNRINKYAEGLNQQVLLSAQTAQKQFNIEDNARKQRIQSLREEQLEREQMAILALQFSSQIAASLTEISRNANEAQLQDLQDRLDKELISQEQYDLEVRQIKRRQAVQDKQLALFQAIVDGAAAVIKAFRDGGLPLSILVGALVGAQVAAIASRPIPAFKKGTKNAPGGPALISEEGPELWVTGNKIHYVDQPSIVDMRPGDKVIPALETAKILQAYNVPFPSMPRGYEAPASRSSEIDYDRLGKTIYRELKKLPIEVNEWDERGYAKRTKKLAEQQTYRQNRYKFARR